MGVSGDFLIWDAESDPGTLLQPMSLVKKGCTEVSDGTDCRKNAMSV
jgi:hypothetical protein